MTEEIATGFSIERIVSPAVVEEDLKTETRAWSNNVRPKEFNDYPGQTRAKENLRIYVKAARKTEKALDHVLLHGPPGLGKTTLARIVAAELESPYVQTSGPSIDKPGDLAGILAGLSEGSVLFIDEIHRLSIAVEEVLYSAMEDFCMDIIVGQGPTARSVRVPIQPFTLVGATTRVSLLSRPLLSRFGIQERLEFYSDDELAEILLRSATIMESDITREGAVSLACRSRGTPRTANRLLRRVQDFAVVRGDDTITPERVDEALAAMEIDNQGLEPMDRLLLETIVDRYQGGPVGIETLSHSVGEDRATIEDVYEPFLVFKGFIQRGPRGREVTEMGQRHIQSPW